MSLLRQMREDRIGVNEVEGRVWECRGWARCDVVEASPVTAAQSDRFLEAVDAPEAVRRYVLQKQPQDAAPATTEVQHGTPGTRWAQAWLGDVQNQPVKRPRLPQRGIASKPTISDLLLVPRQRRQRRGHGRTPATTLSVDPQPAFLVDGREQLRRSLAKHARIV